MIRRREPWNSQPVISKSAHILERTGLALTGASCGLFVAAHVGRADIDLIGSAGVVLAMMLYGAAGFYLGIDLPQTPPDHHMHLPLRHGLGTRADAVMLLSAAGTFLASVAACRDDRFLSIPPGAAGSFVVAPSPRDLAARAGSKNDETRCRRSRPNAGARSRSCQ